MLIYYRHGICDNEGNVIVPSNASNCVMLFYPFVWQDEARSNSMVVQLCKFFCKCF